MQPPLATFLEQVLATAQTGLTYSKDPFDIGRFEALRAATVALIASQSELAPEAIADWIALDSGYPTPKLDVRAFIQNDVGHILLVQERSDGCWTLPGGWCDIGDSPAGAVVREVAEETGLACRAVQLLAFQTPPSAPAAPRPQGLLPVRGDGGPTAHRDRRNPGRGLLRPRCPAAALPAQGVGIPAAYPACSSAAGAARDAVRLRRQGPAPGGKEAA